MALSKALQVGFAFGLAYLEADSDRTIKANELRDWLVGYCGTPKKNKASKDAWSECRKAMCPVTGSINDVLKASSEKHISDCDENTKRARLDLTIRVIKTKLLNGTGAKKGAAKRKSGKATTTKVVGVAKAQVRLIASKPKKLSDTLRVILATIQAQPEPQYKAQEKLIAALQVAIDLAV